MRWNNRKFARLITLFCMIFLLSAASAFAQCPAGQIETVPGSGVCILDPTAIPKYEDALIIPPVMPQTAKPAGVPGGTDYYEIAVRQFNQYILPQSMGHQTPVWSYGSANNPATFNYPAFTVENVTNKPTRVKWINDLKDANGHFLPHLLGNVVDQTLHWANPPGGIAGRDSVGTDPDPYLGPVPLITHVHGAHVGPESDGYPEAWWLPDADNIPAGYATQGTHYGQFDQTNTTPGTAVFQYPNSQAPATLWYHDHALGMTRLNVYAGPAGFWLVRGTGGAETDLLSGTLPGPAPAPGEGLWLPAGRGNGAPPYREIPIALQDRSFYPDGRLFYPDNRAYFEGLPVSDLQIDFAPDSDIAPIQNPEVFSNTIVSNGRTWPYQNVEPVRYRLRLLNGCQARTLNLSMFVVTGPGPDNIMGTGDDVLGQEVPFYWIGTEQGLLPNVVKIETGFTTVLPNGARTAASDPAKALLLSLAERADVIVDFTGLQAGTVVRMVNTGPEVPFNGFPIGPQDAVNPATTGQVMEFVVVPLVKPEASTPPAQLKLRPRATLTPTVTRKMSLNELESSQVCVDANPDGSFVIPITQIPGVQAGPDFLSDCAAADGVPYGPQMALLGTMDADPNNPGNLVSTPRRWMFDITENPKLNAVETWEVYNFTVDGHPVHLHLVAFQVVNRQPFDAVTGQPTGVARAPEPYENGWKDTVIAYPGEITRLKAKFDIPGLYVWHCHIVEHEDNEMMRPYYVGDKVAITSVVYTATSKTLTVTATSSDPGTYQLTATGYGVLSYNANLKRYSRTFSNVQARPSSVTVTSKGGGSATYTFPASDTVTIASAVYDATRRTLSVQATSSDQPGVTLSATGFGTLVYNPTSQNYQATFTNVNARPNNVTVTSSGGGSATLAVAADTVSITSAVYNAARRQLTVTATSSAQPGASLTATGYGALSWTPAASEYRRVFSNVSSKPANVTVTSSKGGSATAAVN